MNRDEYMLFVWEYRETSRVSSLIPVQIELFSMAGESC